MMTANMAGRVAQAGRGWGSFGARYLPWPTLTRRTWQTCHRAAAGIAMAAVFAQGAVTLFPATLPSGDAAREGAPASSSGARDMTGRETIVGGYLGVPDHARSDVKMVRPDGTDLLMKNIRWDAEPFRFPIYAGVRVTRWQGAFGGMIDFMHDKAIARVGKGAHGRKVTGERAIPDVIDVEGKLKGQPAAPQYKITDIIERLEFSHGHNMLLPTALLRLANLSPWFRPYVGVGAGVAIPHVEVFPAGEGEEGRTNEYQLAGPAMQGVFGIEIPLKSGPVFLEYKYTWASLQTNLTGGQTPSWCNCDFVSDFVRNGLRWWRGEAPIHGTLSTTIRTHQVVGGAGYRLRGG